MFSVVLPLHNKESHVKRSIDSILSQTFGTFEIIVVDDASTDGSMRVVEQYTDPRIRVFRRDTPGPGGYAARNLGIREAKYRWIAFLDADDAWEPAYLENVRKAIESNPDVQVFASGYSFVGEGKQNANYYFRKFGGKGSHGFDFVSFLRHKPIWTGAVVMTRELLLETGMFPEGRSLRGGDQDTWMRAMHAVRKGYWIDYLGALYFRDSENMVTKNVGFKLESHVMYNTIAGYLKTEKDPAVRKALKRHWNNTALTYFKNIAKAGVVKPVFWKYYFWSPSVMDKKILLYILYSLKHVAG